MAGCGHIHIFQAVNDEKAEYRRRKDFSKIPDIFGRRLVSKEEKKREESGEHCSQDDHQDGGNLLENSHAGSPPFSRGFLRRVSTPSTASMDGIMKRSAPKAIRHSRERPSPSSALE